MHWPAIQLLIIGLDSTIKKTKVNGYGAAGWMLDGPAGERGGQKGGPIKIVPVFTMASGMLIIALKIIDMFVSLKSSVENEA